MPKAKLIEPTLLSVVLHEPLLLVQVPFPDWW